MTRTAPSVRSGELALHHLVELLELLFLSLHARDEYLLAETIARLGQSSEVSRLDLVVDIECFGLEVIRSLSKE